MREKIKLFRMLWKVIRKKEKGWVFFNLSDEQQRAFLSGEAVDFSIRHVGIDGRVIDFIVKKLGNDG